MRRGARGRSRGDAAPPSRGPGEDRRPLCRETRLPLPREDGLLRGRALPRRDGHGALVRPVVVGLPRRSPRPVGRPCTAERLRRRPPRRILTRRRGKQRADSLHGPCRGRSLGPRPGGPSSPNLHRPPLTARGSPPAPPGAPRGTVARSSLDAPRWSTHETEDLRPSRPSCGNGRCGGLRPRDAVGLDPRHRGERTARCPSHRTHRRARITVRCGHRLWRTGPIPRSRAPRGDVPAQGRIAGLRDPNGRERQARSRRPPRPRRDTSCRRYQGERHGRQSVAPRRRRGRGDPREMSATRSSSSRASGSSARGASPATSSSAVTRAAT